MIAHSSLPLYTACLHHLPTQSPSTSFVRNLPTTSVHNFPPHPPLHHLPKASLHILLTIPLHSLPPQYSSSHATQSPTQSPSIIPLYNLPPQSPSPTFPYNLHLNCPKQPLFTTPSHFLSPVYPFPESLYKIPSTLSSRNASLHQPPLKTANPTLNTLIPCHLHIISPPFSPPSSIPFLNSPLQPPFPSSHNITISLPAHQQSS